MSGRWEFPQTSTNSMPKPLGFALTGVGLQKVGTPAA